jgi:hypothetical protein
MIVTHGQPNLCNLWTLNLTSEQQTSILGSLKPGGYFGVSFYAQFRSHE